MAHATTFDFGQLRYEKAPDYATKARLRQLLGLPARTTQPNYECGPLAGKEFYSLHYGLAIYTGNSASKYMLHVVKFVPGSKPLHYGPHTWTAATTIADLRKLFGADVKVTTQPAGVLLVSIASQGGEDAGVFLFKNGLLTEYNHWQAC